MIYETRRTWDNEEDGPPPVVIVDPRVSPGEEPPDEIGVRPREGNLQLKKRERWEPVWGVTGRLQTALSGARSRNVDMKGLGAGFRYRPAPHVALDLGLDFLRGDDWHGHRREELAFSANALIYLNPKSSFQIYIPVGLHGAGASVDVETPAGTEERNYRYFGAQTGIGGEIQLGSKVSLPIELIGFVRNRTDGGARREPEFVDGDTHLVTNTSAGALLRAGIAVYF